MKKCVLFIAMLSWIPSMSSVPAVGSVQNYRFENTGEIIRNHPYITFCTVITLAYIIHWWFKVRQDQIEYQRLREVIKRSSIYIPYHVVRPANFWKKPETVGGDL